MGDRVERDCNDVMDGFDWIALNDVNGLGYPLESAGSASITVSSLNNYKIEIHEQC
jgi:hypothetical protein